MSQVNKQIMHLVICRIAGFLNYFSIKMVKYCGTDTRPGFEIFGPVEH